MKDKLMSNLYNCSRREGGLDLKRWDILYDRTLQNIKEQEELFVDIGSL